MVIKFFRTDNLANNEAVVKSVDNTTGGPYESKKDVIRQFGTMENLKMRNKPVRKNIQDNNT